MAELLSGAKVVRKLDGEQEVDLTPYSIVFQKCQFVRAYSQDLAEGDGDTILGVNRFVMLKLCVLDSDGACSSNYGYGEYLVEMVNYLAYTVEFKEEEQEAMCEMCEENCYYEAADDAAGDDARRLGQFTRNLADAGNNAAIDCDTCLEACEKIENMEANYYLDATNFINCQNIVEGGDDDDGLYAGPMCASNGQKIKIGVFSDEDCMFLVDGVDVESYLADGDGNGLKLSHALLKTTYNEPIACLAVNEDDDDAAEAETAEVCENVYAESGKCETKHNFDSGISANNNYYAQQAQNQVANEDLVCDFIESLQAGTYSQDGEIVINGSSSYSSGGSATTGGQKFALTFFIIGTIALAVYAAMLHSQLTKGSKADLSTQGGAMA